MTKPNGDCYYGIWNKNKFKITKKRKKEATFKLENFKKSRNFA